MANSISELSSTASINDNDLFVIAQQDRYICAKFNSCSINSAGLMETLVRDVM